MIEAVLTLAGVAVLAGFGLGLAAKFFAVEVDPRVEQIEGVLPGANCGGCGAAGCGDFARGVIAGIYVPSACPVGGAECTARIAIIVGEEAAASEQQVAIVLCAGDEKVCKSRFLYNGIHDCAAAAMISGGPKSCLYGCLGFGSCVRACPFDAINMTDANLAVVHRDRCVACGKCVAACPRHLIQLVPAARRTHILCKSLDSGADVRKKCSVGCTGCKKCERAAEGTGITVLNFLAKIDYSVNLDEYRLETLCPTNSIQRYEAADRGREAQ